VISICSIACSDTHATIGGRWSDLMLVRLKTKTGGESYPEVSSVQLALALLFLNSPSDATEKHYSRYSYISSLCRGFWMG